MHGKAQRVVLPAQTRLQTRGLLDQSLPIFFQTYRGHWHC